MFADMEMVGESVAVGRLRPYMGTLKGVGAAASRSFAGGPG